ncbi:ribosomal-protein-alanine N-acetyltransferase [Flavobacterium swingsii]|jgi:ribosomal-protein-alanine N-acetyltransferase|uniref:Ribosomal-protein-alanine N-acetyltransferase n=1 Tax=Flavobacterium swingsii TaxID=498292 RepID=A0A1I0WHA8_9FLAO|nr:ribosomal-protein-alanine N-acetyltransferase [Flavobacterium swingsii]
MSSFLPFKDLESERLLLRQITSNDVNEVFALRSNPETMKYIPRPLVTTTDDAMDHIKMIQDKIEKNEGINWAITLKDNPKMIGIIGHYRIRWEHFRSEIGYMLLPEYQGKGIITEAIQLMLDYGFNEMKMHSLEAIIDPKNTASAKVLEKNDFVKEAHLIQNEFYDGKFLDTVIYSILNNS